MSENGTRITVYSDYVCPFCYLGRRSLESYQESREQPLDIDWHPFDLRSHKRGPDGEINFAVDDGKDEAYYEQARQNVERLKTEYDVEMRNLDDTPDEVDSLDAQLVSLYVSREYPERWLEFDEAVFEALWVDGRDIGDADVLADIASDVGLASTELRDVLADETLREQLREQFSAAHSAGITGVPTFVYGEHAARGAIPPEQLGRLVDGV